MELWSHTGIKLWISCSCYLNTSDKDIENMDCYMHDLQTPETSKLKSIGPFGNPWETDTRPSLPPEAEFWESLRNPKSNKFMVIGDKEGGHYGLNNLHYDILWICPVISELFFSFLSFPTPLMFAAVAARLNTICFQRWNGTSLQLLFWRKVR